MFSDLVSFQFGMKMFLKKYFQAPTFQTKRCKFYSSDLIKFTRFAWRGRFDWKLLLTTFLRSSFYLHHVILFCLPFPKRRWWLSRQTVQFKVMVLHDITFKFSIINITNVMRNLRRFYDGSQQKFAIRDLIYWITDAGFLWLWGCLEKKSGGGGGGIICRIDW